MGIRLKDLSKLGYRDNVARSLVVDIVGKYCKHDTKEQIAMTLSNILEHPESYKNNEIWSKLAERLSPTILAKEFVAYDLREEPLMYKTYGGKFIETLAKQQMNLASHGAGRAMSRQKAKESFTQSALKKMLSQADVALIGGSIEEIPLAYKDIDRVMYTQETLVEVQGRFMPRIV